MKSGQFSLINLQPALTELGTAQSQLVHIVLKFRIVPCDIGVEEGSCEVGKIFKVQGAQTVILSASKCALKCQGFPSKSLYDLITWSKIGGGEVVRRGSGLLCFLSLYYNS